MSLYGEIEKILNEQFDISNSFRVVLLGRNKAYIEGHNGILNFSTEEICFQIKKKRLTIFGADLLIKSFDSRTAIVTGIIVGTKIV